MHRVFAGLLAALCVSLPAHGQDNPGDIVVSGVRTDNGTPGGLWLADTAAPQPLTLIGSTLSPLDNAASLAIDPFDPTRFYAGTYSRRLGGELTPTYLLRLELRGGALRKADVLNYSEMDEDIVLAVVPLGEHLYYLGRHSVGRVPLSGGKVEQLVELPDWVEPRGMASDGRYLYAAATPFSLVTIDLVDLRTLKPLASIPRGSEEIQNVAMDNEGHLLVVTANPSGNARLLRYHHTSGVLLNQLVLPLIGARAVAQDPENGLIHVVGATAPSTSGVLTIADWKVARGPVGNLPNALPALVIQRPRHAFFQRGLGCKADDGKVPSIGTVGRPGQRAPYFGVTVATTPNSPVLFCAGIEDTNVGPFDLKIIGAPGCWLAVDPFVIAFHRTDARGAAIQYLPHAATPTQYNGIRLNAQWVVGASTANLLGAALSDAVRITIRD